MSSKREQILNKIATNLGAISGMTGSVFRSRVTPFVRNQFPAITVEFLSDEPDAQRFPAPITGWEMIVAVRIFTKADIPGNLSPDQVADPFVQLVHSTMVSDLSLGGLSMDIRPSAVKNELFDADIDTGILSMHYVVQYRTTAIDLS